MLDLFLGIGLCACGLFAALSLNRDAREERHVFLAGWLAAYAVFFIGWIGAGRVSGAWGYGLAALASTAVMLPPVFHWFYTRAATGAPVKRLWPHFLPSVINLALMSALGVAAQAQSIDGAIAVSLPPMLAPLALAPVVFLTAMSAYPVLAYRAATAQKAALKETLSNDAVAAADWIRLWAGSTIVLNLALIGASIVANTSPAALSLTMAISVAAISLQILFVAYKALSSNALASSGPSASAQIVAHIEEPPRVNALKRHMAQHKPYLDSALTIDALSSQIGWPRDEVTRAIRETDANFFDYINRHRVEEAKRLIADPTNANISILSLGMDAGFGSKSSFNAAFRRHVGKTPSQYRASV
ncbi:MAG: AraC family transcriptional regulator [Pseudomonadota bacterium]